MQVENHALLSGRYRILEQIGQGGFGSVYKAEDTAFGNRLVALKEMEQKGLSQEEITHAAADFKREALLLANLRHPHLPRIYDHFSHAGRWYLVMDYIEGETLEVYQQHVPADPHTGKRQLPVQEVLAIGIQLCLVLDYLHTRQPAIIFRDLKPANIMRTPDKHLYLIDFGIARHFKPGQSKDTIPLGSPGYAAPEQYGKKQTTPQADIYSLGVTLHQLLSGDDPTQAPFLLASLQVPGYNPTYAKLAALIKQMTEIDEKHRPPAIPVVKAELENLANRQADKRIWMTPPVEPSVSPEVSGTSLSDSGQQQMQQIFSRPEQKQREPVSQRGPSRRMVIGGLAGLVLAGLGGSVLAWKQFIWSPPPLKPPLPKPNTSQATTQAVSNATVQTNSEPPYYPGSNFIYTGHSQAVTTVAWSPGGGWIASGSADDTVQIWNATNGAPVYTYRGYTSPLTAVAWSPYGFDGSYLVSAGEQNHTVQLWKAASNGLITKYASPGSRVLAVNWQQGTDNVVLGNEDGTAKVWNTKTGQILTTYNGHRGPVQALALYNTHYKTYVASGSADSTLHIWDMQTGNTIATYRGHTAPINAVVWLTETLLASASDDGTVQVWDMQSQTVQLTYSKHKGQVRALAAISAFVISGGTDNQVHVWEYASGNQRAIYTGHKATIRALTVLPLINGLSVADVAPTAAPPGTRQSMNGLVVASASDDTTVHVWNMAGEA